MNTIEILNQLIDPKYTLQDSVTIPIKTYIYHGNYIGFIVYRQEHAELTAWSTSINFYTHHIITYSDPDYQTKINQIIKQGERPCI